MKGQLKVKYRVREVIREAENVSTLVLENSEGNLPSFIAGQYITVYFPESGTPEGKAYSISAGPSDILKNAFSITIKAIGEFSNKLVAMKSGDVVTGSLPYGYFYSESKDTPLVMVAAGIGVAPFRAMIHDCLKKVPTRRISLFYSNRSKKNIVFKTEFDYLLGMYPNLQIYYFITRERTDFADMFQSRISGQKILGLVQDSLDTEFLICGPISFTRDLWRDLHTLGIPEEVIYTEAFFSH